MIHFNIILSFTTMSRNWSPTFRFFDYNFVCVSHPSHACHMFSLSHPP